MLCPHGAAVTDKVDQDLGRAHGHAGAGGRALTPGWRPWGWTSASPRRRAGRRVLPGLTSPAGGPPRGSRRGRGRDHAKLHRAGRRVGQRREGARRTSWPQDDRGVGVAGAECSPHPVRGATGCAAGGRARRHRIRTAARRPEDQGPRRECEGSARQRRGNFGVHRTSAVPPIGCDRCVPAELPRGVRLGSSVGAPRPRAEARRDVRHGRRPGS